MKLSPLLRHLLHHRCSACYGDGWARGYYEAAKDADTRERLIKQLLNQGIDPWSFEQSLRERIAAAEQESA